MVSKAKKKIGVSKAFINTFSTCVYEKVVSGLNSALVSSSSPSLTFCSTSVPFAGLSSQWGTVLPPVYYSLLLSRLLLPLFINVFYLLLS